MALWKIRYFIDDEQGGYTIWSLVWLMLFIAIGGLAADVTNVLRAGAADGPTDDERPESRLPANRLERHPGGRPRARPAPQLDHHDAHAQTTPDGLPSKAAALHRGEGARMHALAVIMAIFRALFQLRDWRYRRVMIRSVFFSAVLIVGLGLGMGWIVMMLPDATALPLINAVNLPLVGAVTVPAVGEVAVPLRQVEAITFPLVIMISSVLMFPIAGMIVNLMLDDIVDAVEERNYPHLPALKPSGLIETVSGAVVFALLVLTVNLGALIFYVVAGALAPLVFWVVNGFMIGHEFFNLIAGRRLPPDEVAALRRAHGYRIGLAGCLMAIPLSLPLVGLVIPVLGAAAFTHMFHRIWRPEQNIRAAIGREPGATVSGAAANTASLGRAPEMAALTLAQQAG